MKHKAAPADSSVLINHVNRLGDSLPFIPLESCNSAVNWIWDKAALLQAGFCKVLSRITTYSTACFVLLLPSTRRRAVKQHSQTPENFPCGSPRLFLFALGVSQEWFILVFATPQQLTQGCFCLQSQSSGSQRAWQSETPLEQLSKAVLTTKYFILMVIQKDLGKFWCLIDMMPLFSWQFQQ